MAYLGLNEYERPDAEEDNAGVLNTERVFRIWYAAFTGAVTILKEVALPQKGDAHPEDSNLICISRGVSSISDDKRIREVTCSYSSLTTDTVTEEDPLKRDPKITWGTFETSVVAEKDNAGGAIENSAGDPYQNPLMVDNAHLEVTIVRNEASYDPDRALSFTGKVNKGGVTIAGKISTARQAKLVQYTGSNQKENEISFWSVTYKFRFKEDTWDTQILDQGFNRIALIGGAILNIPIIDESQQDITVPAKLDKNGQPLAKGLPPEFNTFVLLKEADFSGLGLQ